MVAPSKVAPSPDDTFTIFPMMRSFLKKLALVGAVYALGYMQWSVAWLLGPLTLSVLRERWRRESEARRSLAKATATSSEKEVVLARLDELPAWVFFPDVERAEWLNRILHQVWPNVNEYAKIIIKETVEPAVAESLAQFKLNGFKFERMILGTIPPRIGGVKVYDKNLARDEIIIDVDLFYAGDCDISFALQGIRGGIKDLQIHGTARVVLKPLMDRLPLAGGVQLFFLNAPALDFNLVGAADVLDMPGFSDVLRRCIVEQLCAMMVLPNKLAVRLSDDVPAVDLRMPEPEGILRIHLVQAQNLMKKDVSMIGKGKSDPYAVISVGAQQWKSKHIDNDVNPRWDYWCEARVIQTLGQTLDIEVLDKDDGNDDDKLGRCSLDISQVVRAGRLDTWQTLQEAKHGKVHLRLSWHRLSNDVADLSHALAETSLIRSSAHSLSAAVLCVYVDSCSGLPNARSSRPDPYLTLTLGRRTETSGVQMRTDAPVYQLGHSFLVGDPAVDVLEIKVLDQKTGSLLGQLSYAVSALLPRAGLTLPPQPLALQRSGPSAAVVLALQLWILKEAVKESDEEEEVTPPAPLPTLPTPVLQNLEEPVNGADGADGPVGAPQPVPVETLEKQSETLQESLPAPESPKLVQRTNSMTTSAGEAGLGRLLLSLRYSTQNQSLYVVVHKIMNIPLKDPSNVPDPYVKLYLLPGRAKESKRKTAVVKDNCNPTYDERFEWAVPLAELHSRQLEVTVASHKGFLGGSPVIGQVIVNLNQYDFREAKTLWFDLLPETARE